MQDKNKRKIIGVVAASASQSEQKQLISGIIFRANELNADVAVFSNIYNTAKYHAHVEIENKIYDLINSKKLDGIIVLSESILNEMLLENIKQKLLSRTDIPIISIGEVFREFQSIDNDTMKDIMKITEHLVEVHGFTDIHMLTGPKHMNISNIRVEGYKEVLVSHGIPFDQSKVIYGNFWMNTGEDVAMEYITGKRHLPEAIICANDYMAYGVCDKFLENGISIPKDVTVIGYEFVGERYYHAPILTTYLRNRKAVGMKAAETICAIINGTEPKEISLDGHMIYGNSCSCCTDNKILFKEQSIVRREIFFNNLNLTGNFEQQLTTCRSIPDYISVLQQFAYLVRDVTGIYLCLYEDWCSSDFSENHNALIHNEAMACYTVICPESHSDEPSFFNKYELYPNIIPHSKNGFALYFCPIFFSGRELGYFILQYDHPDGYDPVFRNWLKIAATALEFLRMKNDIHTLLEYNNLSSHHDSLTGLYNKNGLKDELQYLINETSPEERIILVLFHSELFENDESMARKHISVKIDLEIAEMLKKTTESNKKACAKISSKIYAYTAVGKYDNSDAQLIADKLSILINHGKYYSENREIDSTVICSKCIDIDCFDFEDELTMLSKSLTEKINIISQRRKSTYYTSLIHIRTMLYRNPEAEWDSNDICRDIHLSNGHFRATYRELFDVSFHQDVIQSKITYAKYLLTSTVLSLPAIANTCGYDDYKYFLRQFKNIVGITPNVYRKRVILL